MTGATLIRPALVSSRSSFSNPLTPPIGLAYLAGSLHEAGVETVLIDAIGERPDQQIEEGEYLFQGLTIEEVIGRIPADSVFIGVSCMFTQDWPYTRRLIEAIRAAFPRTPIVAGGEHVTALPDFSLEECPALDVLVLGEGEHTVVELAQRLAAGEELSGLAGLVYRENGGIVRTSPRARLRAIDDIAPPAWDLLPMEAYLSTRNAHGVYRGRAMPILATRGCPYECTFCSNPVMYGRTWLARRPENVLDEITGYIKKYDASNFDFYDLTMVLRRDWVLEFCQLIDESGLEFTWQLPSGTRSEVIDDEVAQALYRTGCRNITYAPESGSVETLKLIKKKVQLPRLTASLRSAIRHRLKVKCNLIVGFPHETRWHLIQTLAFAWKMALIGVHDVPFYLFSPYPGSELFEELRTGEFALDNDYFRSLTAYMDVSETTNYCPAVAAAELRLWRTFGMASFYGVSFLVRPWRLVGVALNLKRGRSEVVLEQRLGALLKRLVRSSGSRQNESAS